MNPVPAKSEVSKGSGGIDGLAAKPFRGARLLLVDDDLDSLEMLQFVLKQGSGTVETASSAAEAIEKLQTFLPDVLISDIGLPGEDGLSLIAKVREFDSKNHRHTPAVALTAHTRAEDRMRSLDAGFNNFVPKPVEIDELVEVLKQLIPADSELRPAA
ncbi:MAG: response regulator [Acidobacteriota bacterium]